MAQINDVINAGITLDVKVPGAQNLDALRASMRNLTQDTKLTKAELKEAGVSGSAFIKTTRDLDAALATAREQLQAANAALRQFPADATRTQGALKLAAGAFNEAAMEANALRTSTTQAKEAMAGVGGASSGMAGGLQGGIASLTRMAASFLSIYTVINLIKKSFNEAMALDEQLDKLATSSLHWGLSMQQANEQLTVLTKHGQEFGFSQTEVAAAMVKLRDRGLNVAAMTKDELVPYFQTAIITSSDLTETMDAMATAMAQFNLGAEDSASVADIFSAAYAGAGVSTKQLGDAITAAGAAAIQAGTSMKDYAAVVMALHTLGFEDPGMFQKKLFGAIAAPSAKQLKAWQASGVSPWKAPEDFNATIGGARSLQAMGAGLPGVLGKGVMGIGAGIEARESTLRDRAQQGKDLAASIIATDTALDAENEHLKVNEALARATATTIQGLRDEQASWKDALQATNDALAVSKDALAKVKDQFGQLGDPRINGMAAFDDAIAQNAIEAKRQELQLLRTEDAVAGYGDSLSDAKDRASDLGKELEKLKSAELLGERAYNKQAQALQQQMRVLELQKLQLKPYQLFEENALTGQIARIQRQFSIVNLQRDIQYTPAHEAIADAAYASDVASGKVGGAMDPRDVVARIGSITPDIASAQAATQAAEDAKKVKDAQLAAIQRRGQELSLERDVTYGPDLLRIKQAKRAADESLGLVPSERSAGDILASIPKLEGQYAGLTVKIAALTKEHDAAEREVRIYDQRLADATATQEAYKRGTDANKASIEALKVALKEEEDAFAALDKPTRSEAEIVADLATKKLTLANAVALVGQRQGAQLVALTSKDGLIAKMQELASATERVNTANELMQDPYHQAKVASATVKNVEATVGNAGSSAALGWWNGVNGMATRDLLSGAIGTNRNLLGLLPGFASGGIVPGVGRRDTVPAMLTPGEEVLTRSDPRHRANGGGITIHVYSPSIRSDGDIDRLAGAISRKLSQERQRARMGMPA